MKIKVTPERTWRFPKTAGAADSLFPVWATLVDLCILYANLIDAGPNAPKRDRVVGRNRRGTGVKTGNNYGPDGCWAASSLAWSKGEDPA